MRTNIFTRIIRKAVNMVHPRPGLGIYTLPRTSYDYARAVGNGMGSAVIMAPVMWIAKRFAEAKYIITRRGEAQENHEILELLKNPNSFYSGRLLRMALSVSLSLDGNGYLLKLRNNQLKPIQLWYIPHWMMEPHCPENGMEYIDYYTYKPQWYETKIDPLDVIHFRNGLDPDNVRKGIAPLKCLVREIFTDDEAANFSASLLRNMGVPGMMISPGSDTAVVKQTDKKAVKAAFKQNFGGDRRGEPIIMGAKTEIKTFGFSPAELDLGRLREIPEERVTAILGVPAAVVGFGTGLQQTKVGATMKELREAAYEDCIIPMQNIISEELTTQLVKDFEENPEEWALDFDLSEIRVLQEDENRKSARVLEQVKGCLLTQGEGRKILGYEVRPEHDVYLMPFSITPTPAKEIGKVPVVHEGEEKQKYFLLPVANIKAAGWKERLLQEFMKSYKRLSALFERELLKAFNVMGDQAADAFERVAAGRKASAIDELYGDIVIDGVNVQILDFARHYLRVAQETYDTVNTIMGLGVNLTDEIETEVVKMGGTRLGLIDLIQQTKDAVFQALEEAREAGEGPYEAALRIRDKVAAGPWRSSAIRANVIARTETKYAQNQSSLLAYEAGGIKQVEIVDGQLSTSCDMCIERNGRIITIEQAQALDEHPNGTLSLTPVIGDIRGGA